MKSLLVLLRLVALAFVVLSPAANATDGVIEINHARALAGSVTPGDTPGYPVTISLPGSYKLTGNLSQESADTDVIQVTDAGDSSLDLNGFAIVGANVCVLSSSPAAVNCSGNGIGEGINACFGSVRLVVKNGAIRGMGRFGVDICLGNGYAQNIQVSNNGSDGIVIYSGTIERSKTSLNGGKGIAMHDGSVSDSTVSQNGGDGIAILGGEGVARNNMVSENVGIGIRAKGVTEGNTISRNDSAGFSGDGAVARNYITNNGSYGIVVFNQATVTGNVVKDNAGYGLGGTGVAYGLNSFMGNNGGGGQIDTSLGILTSVPSNSNVCGITPC